MRSSWRRIHETANWKYSYEGGPCSDRGQTQMQPTQPCNRGSRTAEGRGLDTHLLGQLARLVRLLELVRDLQRALLAPAAARVRVRVSAGHALQHLDNLGRGDAPALAAVQEPPRAFQLLVEDRPGPRHLARGGEGCVGTVVG
jgi:hypothetical protein